jgi:hypothetical protein
VDKTVDKNPALVDRLNVLITLALPTHRIALELFLIAGW